MYKIIFSDLDATLLSDDKSICKKNIDAINKANSNGINFLFCTGRLPYHFQQYKDYVDLSNAISCNGAIIINNNEIISDNPLNIDVKETLINYAEKTNNYLRFFGEKQLYAINYSNFSDANKYFTLPKVMDIKEAREYIKNNKIYKMAFSDYDHNILESIRSDLNKLNLDVEIAYSNSMYLEINNCGQNKGNGIKKYCEILGIDLKDTIGIGDNFNDLSMLEVTGLSCCPSNSAEEIKKICDYVSPLNNNDGAVADIINKYIFNK